MQVIVVISNQQPQPPSRRRRLHRPAPPHGMRQTGGDAPAAHPPILQAPGRAHRPAPTRSTIPTGGNAPQPISRAPSRAQDPRRQRSKQIADGTLEALRNGYYDESVAHGNRLIRHDISGDLARTERHTILYPDDSIELRRWQTAPSPQRQPTQQMKISLIPISTLEGARYIDNLSPPSHASGSSPKPLTGVLNFASAIKPGGGFRTGAIAQEESIARSSSLCKSLDNAKAAPFYASHNRDDNGGFYTHAMIYSPNVVLFRDDDGAWVSPIKVEIVTSPAVNAKEVRERHRAGNQGQPGGDGGRFGSNRLEAHIRDMMRERMARILALFELRGVRNIVLGSFGTGVFQNDVRMVAGIWRELLCGQQARFSTSFHNVLFAIPDQNTMDKFKDSFGPVRNPL